MPLKNAEFKQQALVLVLNERFSTSAGGACRGRADGGGGNELRQVGDRGGHHDIRAQRRGFRLEGARGGGLVVWGLHHLHRPIVRQLLQVRSPGQQGCRYYNRATAVVCLLSSCTRDQSEGSLLVFG